MRTDIYGKMLSGETVLAIRLEAPSGAYATVITLGGILTELGIPDHNGVITDVVLGLSSLEEYQAGHPYFGAIAGRVAGRIPGGRFSVHGQEYQLALNDGPNHLHGGAQGLDKRIWHAEPLTRSDGSESVRLTYTSPDGEQGYPGAVKFAVTYTLTPDHALIVETEALSERRTPASLTHHSYFNLAGEGSGSIEDHTLAIFSNQTHAVDEHMTPLHRLVDVDGLACDLRTPRRLGDVIPDWFQQHGELYQLPKRDGADLFEAARLTHQNSGRVLTVSTNESCLQIYTGASLDGSLTGKAGKPYRAFAGLCLECEGYPGAADHPDFGSILLEPCIPRRRTTRYAFSTQ